ncbi:hypothetical protein [Streptomyces venezuelae]|uniref:hypothetical protein n=1 Tax=Streptomyces venezuelae TaxID=54571 RepID=UPI001CC2641D|nr:hypothetical protein [Streptomyces venezuelae]
MRGRVRTGLATAGAAALCTAVAVGAVGALPGAAYAAGPGGESAYRTGPDSRRIEGGANQAVGPTLELGRFYEDRLAPAQERFYQVVLDDRSSVYIAAVARPGPQSKVAYGDGIEAVLLDTKGNSCSAPDGVSFGSEQARPLADVAVRRLEEDGKCQQAGPYYVKLTRTSAKDSDQAPWPVELHMMREPKLSGSNAPQTAPSAWPSAPVTQPSDQRVVRSGGTGFNDARALDAGVWGDTVQPGQTRFYRVPVDWGQQLSIGTELTGGKLTQTSGYAGNGLVAEVFSPARLPVASEDESYDGKQAQVALGPLAPVAYENRYADARAMRPVRTAGWYYLAVTVDKKVGEFTAEDVPLQLTLRVKLTGTAGPGPAYAESLSAAGFGVGEDDRAAARDGLTAPEAADAADTRSAMTVVAATGFGTGTLLLLVLAGWILLGRRSATSG